MTESIVYYGPHACENCYQDALPGQPKPAVMICKAAREQGGEEFDYPEGPIYPNTVWQPHVHRVFAPSEPAEPAGLTGAQA
jgi:hypothetical protein